MKIRSLISILLLAAIVISFAGCKKPGNTDTPDSTAPIENSDVPQAFLIPMKKLLSEWGIRKGSMSDPFIGARILMYEKTKSEVGYAVLDIDGNGVDDMIAAPLDGFAENGLVYDILTINDGEAFHLANSLQETYHFMDDGSFIVRTPTAEGKFTFKRVTLNGTERPTEVEITKEESAKYRLSTVELTPFSDLEK